MSSSKNKVSIINRALVVSILLPLAILAFDLSYLDFSQDSGAYLANIARLLGSITGFAGAVMLIWEFLLSTRFIANRLSSNLPELLKLHSKLGKYGFLLIVLHPIAEIFYYSKDFLWVFLPNFKGQTELFITIGRVAFYLIAIIWVTSALLKKRIAYRPWLYIHYISYPALFFTLIHIKFNGSTFDTFSVYGFPWNLFIPLFIILSILRIYYWSGLPLPKYKVASVSFFGDKIFTLKLNYVAGKNINLAIGQYLYVQLKPFSESHPFTVLFFDSSSGDITLGVKNVGKFSKKLSELKAGDEVLMEGPYGSFTLEGQNDAPKVILAGGIGVTPFIQLAILHPSNCYFLYSNQKLEEAIMRSELKAALNDRYFDFITREEQVGKNIVSGRITSEFILKTVKNFDQYNYFICGSQSFIESMGEILSSLKVSRERVFIEEFEF